MIIEFIGCTGAGKTTLFTEVQRKLAQAAQLSTAFEVVAAPLGLRRITHPTAQNLIQEVAGLPFFVRSLHQHAPFLGFILSMLARHGKFTFQTLNYLRSLERTVGVYESIRHHEQGQLVLVDEGTLILAHNVFVYTEAHYTPEEIAQFAQLAPLPDLIVYIKAPVDTLLQRTLQRTDPPRELKARTPAVIEHYIKRAATMFEQLVQTEALRSRVLVVENLDTKPAGRDRIVTTITDFILKHTASDPKAKVVWSPS